MHGNGTYLYTTGDVYEGMWSEGLKNGKGTYTFKEQSCIVKLLIILEKRNLGKWYFTRPW